MVCPFERAAVIEQRHRDGAIAIAVTRARAALAQAAGPSLTHCEDCDGEIPEARRAQGGITRCVPCQTTFERGLRR
ncbi:prophage PSPPH06, DksA/TraR family C4-type zinc finger protein [Pseudomonas chlororaphis subsp. aurantiaca]|uniref:TraR/DksA C4-type zinc finger protein n=1 Tax=Pseudomonas chlororaphis TaxID=587753 RepID=UPI0008657847|nr:TraR/DksA C4-type zinc finger protein [Pseudomonas chlororaphis]BAV77760.1 prophage PSPPH06, DksA/TraR family C4-type zinc finger protein [Pseudomonas chlororaphis subsp. aurantiaca]